MARLHTDSRNGAVSTSILEKGSPANAVLAVIMALVMVIGFMPLPGYSGQAYADDGNIAPGTSGDIAAAAEELPEVIVTPLVDHGNSTVDEYIDPETHVYVDPNTDMTPKNGYEATVTKGATAHTYNVDITANGLKEHYNLTDNPETNIKAYWVGIGLPKIKGTTYTMRWPYPNQDAADITPGEMETEDGKSYDVFYFGALTTFEGKSATIYAKNGDTTDTFVVTFDGVVFAKDVTVQKVDHGKVFASTKQAAEGEKVVLTVLPDDNYLIDDENVHVVGATSGEPYPVKRVDPLEENDEDDQLEAQADGGAGEVAAVPKFTQYSFTMGKEAVSVSAVFRIKADLTDLKKAIANARAAMKGVWVSEDGADVFYDKFWVTEDVANELLKAIVAGEDLDETAHQTDVNAATEAIEDQTEAFVKAEKNGSKSYEDADVEKELANAQDLLNATMESTDGTDIKDTEYWATATDRKTFSDAIDDVKAKVKEQSITPKAAYAALEKAEDTFNEARKLGKVDMAALEDAIGDALELIEDAVIASDPAEIPAGETFYKKESVDALNGATAAAQDFLALTRVSQDDINEATAELNAAIETFEASAQKGTKAKVDISKATVAAIPDQAYTGKEIEPALTVTLGGKELVADIDYTVAYTDNTEIGKATVTITGVWGYEGTKTANFNIVKEVKNDISKATFSEIEDQPYTGKAIKPAFTVTLDKKVLKEKTDYTVAYKDNTEIGEATIIITGAGDYAGTATTTFNIKKSIEKATIAKIEDQTYTAKAIEPEVKVTLNKKELKEDTDFTVSYSDNIEVGTATVTVTGAGEYAGKVESTFAITSAAEAAKATMTDLDETAWYMGGDGSRGGYFPGTNTLYLDYALARGLMSGYTKDGKVVGFGPNNSLKRAQTATVLYRMTHADITPTTDPAKYETNKTGLSDVESNQYYTAAVNWAYAEGVMTGYTDDAGKPVAFGPDDSINREQIATTIGRWCMSDAGGKMPKPTKKASDLYDDAQTISDWAQEGAAFCNENGIMTGVGGTKNFDPKANAERCQMAKIIAVTDKLGSQA